MRPHELHNCCGKRSVKRGLWSPEEDVKLIQYINSHGPGSWASVPERAGLRRCGKSCRLRWMNYLRPGIKHGNFSGNEQKIIFYLQSILGNRWSQIARYLPERTDSEIKNYWNSSLRKRIACSNQTCNETSARHNMEPNSLSYEERPLTSNEIDHLQYFPGASIATDSNACVQGVLSTEEAGNASIRMDDVSHTTGSTSIYDISKHLDYAAQIGDIPVSFGFADDLLYQSLEPENPCGSLWPSTSSSTLAEVEPDDNFVNTVAGTFNIETFYEDLGSDILQI